MLAAIRASVRGARVSLRLGPRSSAFGRRVVVGPRVLSGASATRLRGCTVSEPFVVPQRLRPRALRLAGGQRAVLRVTWKRDRRRSRAPQRARVSATPGVGSREPQERLAAGRARGPADVGEAWGPRRGRPLRSAGRRVRTSVCAARDSRGPTSCRPLAASDVRPPSLRPVADTSLLKTPKKQRGGETVRFLLLVTSNLTQAPEPVALS